ncbi:hypothetical protein CesoFtcFv8_024022 [Champsocephalus esox]|uniref:Uncharacterized protein n=1 Tax=Champsocephalus esox TaxID=159716 RepID=A0AAN8B4X0_9TELE|nr:hypothetical protein CesoFtcFv8_024022 [Champsocephalus esox]
MFCHLHSLPPGAPHPPSFLPVVTPSARGLLCPQREWQLWSQGVQRPRLTMTALFLPRAESLASSEGPGQNC